MIGCDPFPRNRPIWPGDEGQSQAAGNSDSDNLIADGGCNPHPCVNQETPHPYGSD